MARCVRVFSALLPVCCFERVAGSAFARLLAGVFSVGSLFGVMTVIAWCDGEHTQRATCLVFVIRVLFFPGIIAWADLLAVRMCNSSNSLSLGRGQQRGALGALRRGAWHGASVFFRLSFPCVVLSASQAQYLHGCSLGCFQSVVCFMARCDGEPTQLPMIFVLIRSFSFVRSHTF